MQKNSTKSTSSFDHLFSNPKNNLERGRNVQFFSIYSRSFDLFRKYINTTMDRFITYIAFLQPFQTSRNFTEAITEKYGVIWVHKQ